MERLPIEDAIAPLLTRLAEDGVAVLQAPPGAGKTTRVPLALLEADAVTGRIVMLEPRRLAARAAAERMASILGEEVGARVGYRMRGDTRVSKATRIEVVTEGILTRMMQNDPELPGIGLVIFDEFHERSLNGDLGLALAIELRDALREDLQLLVMSATLDAKPVADMLGAEIVTSQGRAFPVETYWLDRPLPQGTRFETAICDLIRKATSEHAGSVLVFLPGEREIRRVQSNLDLGNVAVRPLYGALPFAEQRAAIAPGARKVVLATSIAETSLTIEDIRVVIDGGKARRARFDPGSGMSRLVTEKVSRAEADQRRGRAGRIAVGACYRLWAKAEEGALPLYPPPEIETADLTGLALGLAAWGSAPGDLAFLTQPPAQAFAQARSLLEMLGALDAGRITKHGRALAQIPLHPRLAHMLACSGSADIAAILGERDLLGRSAGCDLALRLRAVKDRSGNPAVTKRIIAEIKRLSRFAKGPDRSVGEMAALAYPDRIGLRRKGDDPRYVLSGGKGCVMDPGDVLAAERLIVALDLDGDTRDARVRLAASLTEAELRGLYGDQLIWIAHCRWSKRHRRVEARKQECLAELVLKDELWKDASEEAVARAMLEGVRDLGLSALNWTKPAKFLRARVRTVGTPDWSDATLLGRLEDWLLPFLGGAKRAGDLKEIDLHAALLADLGWDGQQMLDRAAPAEFVTPLGRKIAIDYSGEQPAIAVRLQEMFGTKTHPKIGDTPLQVTLLSPAQRPVQVTTNIPEFWKGSYADVRKDMRARYPKHPWPEDPSQENPTLRAKPR